MFFPDNNKRTYELRLTEDLNLRDMALTSWCTAALS